MPLDQSLHVQRLVQCLVPALLIEVGGAALDLPSFRMYIIVQGEIIHKSVTLL